jgi:hypothetical protein
MALDNYRDLSLSGTDVNAGFQFEFYCSNCSRKWKSPFQPYRMGQLSGFLSRFAFLFSDTARTASRASGNFADMGSRGARDSALADAMQQAEALFTNCAECRNAVCADCYSPRDRACKPCVSKEHAQAELATAQAAAGAAAQSALSCPNCRAAGNGGRFCAECGFDMASTHKSCPHCGVMLPRQSRFCTDCGHGF